MTKKIKARIKKKEPTNNNSTNNCQSNCCGCCHHNDSPSHDYGTKGIISSMRRGMKKVAGTDGQEAPPSTFDKICDVLFYIGIVVFLIWFLYRKAVG